jgi:hypothetical protein
MEQRAKRKQPEKLMSKLLASVALSSLRFARSVGSSSRLKKILGRRTYKWVQPCRTKF